MKMTLLDMVQDILSDMDSDEVNSINDTVEAMQIARIIRTTYQDIISSRDWPHLRKLVQVESLSDLAKPNYLKIPTNVEYLNWIKYDLIDPSQSPVRHKSTDVPYVDPENFIEQTSGRNSADTDNVITVYDDTVGPLLINKTRGPSYYTVFDDEHIVCDAYDSTIEQFLQGNKTICHALTTGEFTIEDEFIPDLPGKVFAYLLSESKSVAFNAIGQAANPKEEQRSRRARTYTARNKRSQNKKAINKYPDYGRKGANVQRNRGPRLGDND